MDEIMYEENRHLQSVVNQIDAKVQTLKNKYAAVNGKAHATTYDSEDLATKQYYIGEADLLRERITETQSYRNSPYFAHMEFDCTPSQVSDSPMAGPTSIYIGKPGFQIDDTLIVDWRAPLGQTYYQKNQKQYDIKGTTYSLQMRRALQISNAKLLHYETEFDSSDFGLQNKIGDPFLKRVLRDKRRERRLTDIITTIQENQNQIITRPYRESFAVQGCAGSGKTMILLHRLSYLLYNYKELKPSRIKIITPNLYFNTFIDDLSEELGLHEIQRFTVEEYYVRLIHAYSSAITITPAVIPESGLAEDYLETVYSTDFLQKISKKYHVYCDDCLNRIDFKRLKTILKQYGITLPDYSSHKIEVFRELSQLISIAMEDFNRILREYNDLKKRIDNAEQSIKDLKVLMPKQADDIEKSMVALTVTLESLAANTEKKLDPILTEKAEIDEEIRSQSAALAQNEDILLLKEALQKGREDAHLYVDYISVKEGSGALVEYIREQLQDLILQVDSIDTEYESVPKFNFTKRNRLAKQRAQLRSTFNSEIAQQVSVYLENLEITLKEKLKEMPQDSDHIVALRKQAAALEQEIAIHAATISAARNTLKLLSDPNRPNLQQMLPANQFEIIDPYTSIIRKSINAYHESRENLKRQQDALNSCELKMAKLNLPDKADIETVSDAKSILETSLVFDNFKNVILRSSLDELSEKFEIKKSNKQCRHHLYLLLALCTISFKTPNINDTFINIDEAQDLAVTEYKVLHAALGKHSIFNLYGDVNQLVYSYKGITDWDDISEITGNQLFVLNENYRNTMQITEYCNQVFGAEIYPIGISGGPVKTMALPEALQHIKKCYESDPGSRVAILISSYAKSNSELLATCWDMDFHWMDTSKAGVSVLTVEMVKGLEFDHILVIPDNMTDNEMYIAYTRALETLTVVAGS